MTALIIIASVIAALTLIMILRVGAALEYSEGGIILNARIASFSITLLPAKKRPLKEKKTKPKKTKMLKKEEIKKGGKVEVIFDLLPIISDSLGRLKRKLTINDLIVYYTVAGEDPAAAALTFGLLSAGAGIILPIIENNFKVLRKDVKTAVNFTDTESSVYVKARFSIAVGSIVYVALRFALKFLLKNQSAKLAV